MSRPSPSTARPFPSPTGQTIIQAAQPRAGVSSPPVLPPGIQAARLVQAVYRQGQWPPYGSCTMRPTAGMVVESETEELNAERRTLTQMLFVEATISALVRKERQLPVAGHAYHLGMMSPHFDHFFPRSAGRCLAPEVLLDFNRCILCSLCVRASRDVDGKTSSRCPGAASRRT